MKRHVFHGLQGLLIVGWAYILLTVHVDEYELLATSTAFEPHPQRGWFLGMMCLAAELSCLVIALLGRAFGVPARQVNLACGLPAAAFVLIVLYRITE